MKKLLLATSAFFAFGLFAQTTLYSENFESGGGSIALNTSDMGSFAGTGGTNYWVINNSYIGGTGSVICLGFPFSFNVANTPAQPGGITGAPSSNYLHIVSTAAVSSGINCSSFQAADGLCTFNENNFSRMTSDISTSGYENVSFNFWWICGGAPTIYGEVYYSTDGGSTWSLQQGLLNNQATWTQSSYSNALWDNQPTLRFGFRFVNTQASAATEPSFSIDDIEITGTVATSTPEITTSITNGTSVYCGGDNIDVNYAVTDVTLNMGNIFTLELSDATGSFAMATSIGTVNSTDMTGNITGTIPTGATPGLGYRVRVNSSNDVQIGVDNGLDLIIASTPAAPTIILNFSGDLESSYTGTNIWFQDGFVISGENGNIITPLADGIYTVQATNDTCVSALSDPFTYSTVGVDSYELNAFAIYPNPTSEVVNLKGNEATISALEVVDISGKVLSVQTQSLHSIDVSRLAAGSYFLRIHTPDMMHTLKFIKE